MVQRVSTRLTRCPKAMLETKGRPDRTRYSQEFSDTKDSNLEQGGRTSQPSRSEIKRKSVSILTERGSADSRVEIVSPEKDTGELTPALRLEILMSINKAMEIMGRTGRDVFFEILQRRYGVSEVDIVDYPGKFMTALKLMFDTSAYVIESHILAEIYRNSGVKGVTLEDVLNTLKSEKTEIPETYKVENTASVETATPTAPFAKRSGNPIQEFLSQVDIQNGSKPKAGFSYHYSKKADLLTE